MTLFGSLFSSYCLPAWSGLCTAADRTTLSETVPETWVLFLQRLADYNIITNDAEDTIFKSILRNAQCVLQPCLEERPQLHYNLRNRPGINKTLNEKTVDLDDRDFIVHNLYQVSY